MLMEKYQCSTVEEHPYHPYRGGVCMGHGTAKVAIPSNVGGTPNTEPRETVNHPNHYGGDTVYEAIKVIRAWKLGFNLGNTVKYISRNGKKPESDRIEDLKKALWYLQDEIKFLEDERRSWS